MRTNDPLRTVLYPELKLVPAAQRVALWHEASVMEPKLRHMAVLLGALIAVAIAAVLAMWAAPMVLDALGLNGAQRIVRVAIPGVCVAIGMFGLLWLQRRAMRRDIRRILVKRGVTICIPCGYDLTGNTSGRCPECGTPCGAQAGEGHA